MTTQDIIKAADEVAAHYRLLGKRRNRAVQRPGDPLAAATFRIAEAFEAFADKLRDLETQP